MVTFVVASKSNQPYLAECQILGEFLEKNCPDVAVKFIIKHQSEWSDFLDAVRYKFLIIYRLAAATASMKKPVLSCTLSKAN